MPLHAQLSANLEFDLSSQKLSIMMAWSILIKYCRRKQASCKPQNSLYYDSPQIDVLDYVPRSGTDTEGKYSRSKSDDACEGNAVSPLDSCIACAREKTAF